MLLLTALPAYSFLSFSISVLTQFQYISVDPAISKYCVPAGLHNAAPHRFQQACTRLPLTVPTGLHKAAPHSSNRLAQGCPSQFQQACTRLPLTVPTGLHKAAPHSSNRFAQCCPSQFQQVCTMLPLTDSNRLAQGCPSLHCLLTALSLSVYIRINTVMIYQY